MDVFEATKTGSSVEYFYDFGLRKAVLLGSTALKEALSSPHAGYVQELIDRNRLAVVQSGGRYAKPLLPESTIEDPSKVTRIFPLGEVLKDAEAEFEPSPVHLFRGIAPDRCLAFGAWAYEQARRHDSETTFDISLIERGHRLGIGPSVKQLTDRFGSLTQYYTELEITKTLRKNQFIDWSDQRFIRYLGSIGETPNRPPSMRHIIERSKNSVHNPSFNEFVKRFGGGNGALELAGYWIIPSWDDKDYVEWGLQFALTNNGRPPMMREMYGLSKEGLSPSSAGVARRFGKISHYQSAVREAYSGYMAQHETVMEELRHSYIHIPELFNGSLSEKGPDEERDLTRYARHRLLKSLPRFEDLPYETTTKLCKLTDDFDFIPTLAGLNRSLSIKEIKGTATRIGMYSYVSSMSHHRRLLKIPEKQLSRAA